jgi:hypothetical protein
MGAISCLETGPAATRFIAAGRLGQSQFERVVARAKPACTDDHGGDPPEVAAVVDQDLA